MRPGELRRQAWIHAALALAVARGRASAQEETIGALPLSKAAAAFAELARAGAADGGALWGVQVTGPVLLVDPATRKLVANEADAEGRLTARGGVFVGTLPPDEPIANAPVEWAGKRWAMALVLFLGESEAERVTLLAHESFHRVQPGLGLYPFGAENSHLDAPAGRRWLQLEWNALAAALAAEGEVRRAAVQDALDFRAARRASVAGAAASENALELREGLANYTGLRLAARGVPEVLAYVAERRRKEETFVRSFAYSSGPLYGYLLDAHRPGWRTELTAESDLGALLAATLALAPDAERAEGRAAYHGDEALRAAEEARERQRQERLARFRAELVDGPVLVLDLTPVTARTMDTRKTFPFGPGQTVFTERRLVAAWGRLEVTGEGAILEDAEARLGRVSLRGAAADRRSGPGWKLELAEGWTLVPGTRDGDFRLRAAP
jgi:hypothetical protein